MRSVCPNRTWEVIGTDTPISENWNFMKNLSLNHVPCSHSAARCPQEGRVGAAAVCWAIVPFPETLPSWELVGIMLILTEISGLWRLFCCGCYIATVTHTPIFPDLAACGRLCTPPDTWSCRVKAVKGKGAPLCTWAEGLCSAGWSSHAALSACSALTTSALGG